MQNVEPKNSHHLEENFHSVFWGYSHIVIMIVCTGKDKTFVLMYLIVFFCCLAEFGNYLEYKPKLS